MSLAFNVNSHLGGKTSGGTFKIPASKHRSILLTPTDKLAGFAPHPVLRLILKGDPGDLSKGVLLEYTSHIYGDSEREGRLLPGPAQHPG